MRTALPSLGFRRASPLTGIRTHIAPEKHTDFLIVVFVKKAPAETGALEYILLLI